MLVASDPALTREGLHTRKTAGVNSAGCTTPHGVTWLGETGAQLQAPKMKYGMEGFVVRQFSRLGNNLVLGGFGFCYELDSINCQQIIEI